METTRREFLQGATGLALGFGGVQVGELPLIEPEDLEFLRGLARATLDSATRSDSLFDIGFSAITPGGNYPSIWVRDLSMASGCGLISSATLLKHLRLIASTQNGPDERVMGQGKAVIPPWAIPDHVRFDGQPVFYPGTYSSGDDQGGEPFGVCPPIDDSYEFIQLAHSVWQASGRAEFLEEAVGRHSLHSRLLSALAAPPCDMETGMVRTDAERRAVGFGFYDTVYLTGSLLFPSLLRYRALREFGELEAALGMADRKEHLEAHRAQIRTHLAPVFERDGWLIAATEVGRQPDVWGTIYALYLGVAQGSLRKRLQKTVVEAVRKGTITYQGAVRHVPTDRDFSKDSAWEKTAGVPKNRYQNGAYWHVPSGWLAKVLWEVDKPLARRLVKEMIAHFREEDFRRGGGAPWECLHPQENYRQNRVYLASATLPLEALG